MSENQYDEKLCKQRCKAVDEKLELHDKRLNNHADRLDKLEQNNVENRNDIKHLCEEIKNLVTTMKWFMGLLMGSFIAFFFYAVEKGLFK